ncbi:MAG: molybdopterin-binding protein [Peptococcaceae bacterium]|nr:molybdopterin-binding protein [Peptococcaceae bacterium]
MKKVKTTEAAGLTLCHDITAVKQGFKGPAFRRGHVVVPEDIPLLLDLGKQYLFVWEEEAGEIHEEDAARALAEMTYLPEAGYSEVSEGKITLSAKIRGQFRVDRRLLKELNSVGDITISTIADHYPVEPGMKIASMRIVPLVTKAVQIEKARILCQGKSLFAIHPYLPRKTGVVITGSEVYHHRIQDLFQPVIREKLSSYPAKILGVTFCDDDPDMLDKAARQYLDQGADLIIFTGGMSVDPDDLTPTAIKNTGARIVTQGVPSQPGNMFMLGYLGDAALIGVPGAAIHAKTTVLDVVLPQLFTGESFTKADFIRLGDGGLCLQCPVCHFPNCTFGRY